MSTTLDGADVAVYVDTGELAPFVLDTDILGTINDADGVPCELTPATDVQQALAELSASVVGLELTWGASEWMGPLTLTEAGTATLSFYDPDRRLDPGNTAVDDPLTPGRYLRVDVDGVPVWTGAVSTVTHDLGAELSSITGVDAVPALAAWAVSVDLAQGLVSAQATQMLTGAGWPAGQYRIEGTSSVTRKAERYTGNLAAGLRRLADAELGALFVDRTGVVVFRCRSQDEPTGVDAIVGDAGIGIVNLANVVDRRVINTIVIDMGSALPARTYRDQPSIDAYGTSSLSIAAADLNLL